MSSRNWTFRIRDILQSIEKIESYLKNVSFNQFKRNDLLIDAVIRNFEIIGEASKHIPLDIQSSYPDIPWKQMNSMRNNLFTNILV